MDSKAKHYNFIYSQDRGEIVNEIRRINNSCPIVETERSKIDLDQILDLHAYDGLGVNPDKFANVDPSITSTHLDLTVGTVTLRHPGKVKLSRLELFLQHLLWDDMFQDGQGLKVQVLRLKGLVALDNAPKPIIIQGVHDTYDTYETDTECSDCTIVIIGRYLEFDQLQRALSDTLIES